MGRVGFHHSPRPVSPAMAPRAKMWLSVSPAPAPAMRNIAFAKRHAQMSATQFTTEGD